MTRNPTAAGVAEPDDRIVFVCRDPALRALVEPAVRPAETCPAAVDALLAVARKAPRAVLLNLRDLAGSERDVVAALVRCRPQVPVYALLHPEDEPVGRALVQQGAADYFVLPGDIARVPSVLRPPPEAPSAGVSAADPRAHHLFLAACRLTELAAAAPQALFCDGSMLILGALGVRRGCALARPPGTGRLDAAMTYDQTGSGGFEAERAAAERALGTGEVLLLPDGTVGVRRGGLLCVPVRDAGEAFGAICFTDKTDGTPLDQADRGAAAALADALARLCRLATQRDRYARLALRDVETGLLKADPFLTHLEALITRAEDARAEVGLLLIEAAPGAGTLSADVQSRLGAAIQAALARGMQGGRLDTGLYAVTVPGRRPGGAEADGSAPSCEAAARRLAGAPARVHAGLRVRTGLAVFPHDGATAKALVSAARGRLAASG